METKVKFFREYPWNILSLSRREDLPPWCGAESRLRSPPGAVTHCQATRDLSQIPVPDLVRGKEDIKGRQRNSSHLKRNAALKFWSVPISKG